MSIESCIVDGARSPIGLKNGEMVGVRSDDLSAMVIKGMMARNIEIPKEIIEDVVVGCAFPEGPQGMLMARAISILSDLPVETGGKIVNRFCGSSMDSVHQVSQAIMAGDIDAGIAAGVEDMFGVPMGGFNPSFHPELYEKELYIGMGDTAEILAKDLDIDLAEAIMRTEVGSDVSKMSSKEVKRDLLIFAKKNPKLFLDLASDENVMLRNFGIKATEMGILKLSSDQRTFSWGSNNRKLMNVPFDEHPYSALAAWFKTDEGMEIYSNIEKRLN